MDYRIESWEREYLRDYAKKQLEIANLPVMAERTKRWYAHNENKKGTPMIVVELGTFKNEVVTDPKTVSPFAQEIEREIRNNILVHEMFDDDEVCPDFITMSWDITYQEFGLNIPVRHATDSKGRDIGFVYDHPINTIAEDFHKLKPFTFTVDRENTLRRLNAAKEIMGDILKVELMNGAHRWCNMVTLKAIQLMGMEEWMIEMIDTPEDAHMLMDYIVTNLLAYFHWMENENILTMNNGNHYAGAGSRGFTHELKMPADGHVRLKDMWVNVNSQESSAISPSMYKEFVFPYIERIAKEFGMVYYGCCEAIDPLWDMFLKDLSNLRKVSISPWCNEEFMGERLKGTNIIYSRKPDPKFLGVGYDFDDFEYKAYMKKTLNAARGCNLEIIFRDVYTLSGNPSKVKRAVKLLREVIEKNWQ
jgi:hypothetical protein